MHKKQSESNESEHLMQMQADFLASQKARLDAFAKAQTEVMKQIETINREVLSDWQEIAEQAREIASQAASSPSDAPRIYYEWFTGQFERMVEQSRRFSNQWMALLQNSVTHLQNGGTEQPTTTAAAKPAAPRKIEPVKPRQLAGD